MLLSDFDFDLPEELIATRPANPRSSARLLVAKGDKIFDSFVDNLPKFLKSGDRLVFNDTKVLPARLNGVRSGASSNFAIFSFHSHKNMSTLGEGGMLLVADPKIAAIVPKIRHNGHASYVRQNNDYWLPAMSDVVMPILNGGIIWPGNFCLSEVSCLVGRKLLARVDQMNAIKRSRALNIIDEFRQNSELEFHREDCKIAQLQTTQGCHSNELSCDMRT